MENGIVLVDLPSDLLNTRRSMLDALVRGIRGPTRMGK